jgi:hypothetical protein
MGRSLKKAQSIMWLASHATKIAEDRKIDAYLRKNVKFAMLGGSHGFVATFVGPVEHYLRDWGPEKLGKLVALGAADSDTRRTSMSKIGSSINSENVIGEHDGDFLLRMLAIDVMLSALYDETVVREGRRRTKRGEHHYEDNGRKCYHGPTVTIMDNGRQVSVPNPYWRPEAMELSNFEKQQLGRYFEKMEAEGHPPM